MSLFDDDEQQNWYYEAETEFDENVLKHASQKDMHAMVYLLRTMDEALETLQRFSEQDPQLSKADRIAIESDAEEASQALSRACNIIPEKNDIDN
ncbi:hypothetical protein ACOZ4N_15965 [Halorientalis pallida]|uniref:hypothetical protein n=1 Tax=Halorientalis pallida TaxID=2479928 RepID=UPI003C6F9734